MFAIDSGTGVVTTLTSLDRELVELHYFRVTAVDDSFPPRSGTTTLQINVLDANDHAPVFESGEYEAAIRESVSVGSTVVTLKATDQDIGRNAEVIDFLLCMYLPLQGVCVSNANSLHFRSFGFTVMRIDGASLIYFRFMHLLDRPH